jgi:phosphate acetyltransferase
MSFIENVFEKLKRHPKRIVFPDGMDTRVQAAAFEFASKELGIPILLGNKEEIQASLKNNGFVSPFIKVIEPKKADDLQLFISHLEKLQRYRGIALSEGETIICNPNYFATMMVQHGQADGLVGGANIGAGSLLRPLFQIIKPLPGVKTISSCTLLRVPDCSFGHQGLFVLGDCSIIPHPSVEQLSCIAVESAKLFRQLTGETPRVAMLSYSTKGTAPTQDAEKIIAATALAKKSFTEQNIKVEIDGELQADVALVESIAAAKAPGSLVAGKANVLIFPDLNSGSISCRLIQRLAKADAYGQILLGLDKPAGDVSRGASSAEILGVAAIVAVQAINYRNLYPEQGANPQPKYVPPAGA